ncbi:MAG: hypothetical protein LC808_42810, partial [Actinobacteria bacterium]|nr:hypothetical protein [Actinomycetota bacterium]
CVTGTAVVCHGLGDALSCGNGVCDGVTGLGATRHTRHKRGRNSGYGDYSVLTRSSRASRWAPWVLIVRGNRAHTRARW